MHFPKLSVTQELKYATFPKSWVLQRFKTAKVTFSLNQGHWQLCHSTGYTRFPINLPFPRYYIISLLQWNKLQWY